MVPVKPTANPVDLRVPLGWRLYVGVFGAVWLALCGTFAVQAFRDGSATGVVVLFMLLFGETLVVRTLRARATTSGSTLTVRNVLSTRRLERDQIESVRVGRPSGNPAQLGQVLTVLDRSGGTTTIDASMRTAFTAAGKEALAEQREALEAWRRSRRA
jgi:hypothetical protein